MGWLSDSMAPAFKLPKYSPEPEGRSESITGLRRKSWKVQAQVLRAEVQVLWFILEDRRTPWYARLAVGCAVGYVFSPIQLIPSFIPVIGLVDDFLALAAGFKLAHWLAPEAVIRDARQRALASVEEKGRVGMARAGRTVAIVAIWLMLMAAGMVWMYKP